jgi:phosphopantothenoylcysteine decarboxylase/phosphopantothenate--cysteine ligase
MWENPATQRNVETLRARGVQMVGPCAGRLACGTEGLGRMAEPPDILAAIEELAGERKKA